MDADFHAVEVVPSEWFVFYGDPFEVPAEPVDAVAGPFDSCRDAERWIERRAGR